MYFNQQLIWYDGEKHIEDHFLFADSIHLRIFTINFIRGDPSTALIKTQISCDYRGEGQAVFRGEDPLGLPSV